MTCITSKHLKYLKRTLENKHEFSYSQLYFVPYVIRRRHSISKKYMMLRQDTSFFKNLISVLEIAFTSDNVDEWHIRLDLKNIPQEIADFAIAYVWMCPIRWFSNDYRAINSKLMKDSMHLPPFNSFREMCAWNIINQRFKKIAREHLPICNVESFLEFNVGQ